ncbi:Ef-Hand And Coiled-Coil Domain-Containing Protein 1 [Manis pentadactyla]|nr:Ef-Hand And Coiled-Coil Domain-Containing Protein 1 [Manis pentadactyla]
MVHAEARLESVETILSSFCLAKGRKRFGFSHSYRFEASSLENETTRSEKRNTWPLTPCLKLGTNPWRSQASTHGLHQSSRLGGPLDDP